MKANTNTTAKVATCNFFGAKLGYATFKRIDLDYKSAEDKKHNRILAALRDVQCGKVEGKVSGKSGFFVRKGAQGFALVQGVDCGGFYAFGAFGLKKEQGDKFFSSMADVVKFVKSEGKGCTAHLKKSGKRIVACLGEGERYSLLVASDGVAMIGESGTDAFSKSDGSLRGGERHWVLEKLDTK